ncbi:uncharacterized protein MAM_03157 [Metarhizium album ARSEF 1941]|uniref:Uncharacterized protein n=1 Tax=Metarhizium album (strain ARSEF 1941) TaxID=1081103 RepID=A0A0B2X0T9_METAS|nr:uncharacterized protein MAM_03157 [Metarhizium album ARSEF 1941]KHN98695.1 hypothetical protein MAM_03157 [Metarhizium album ARSEF 1941]
MKAGIAMLASLAGCALAVPATSQGGQRVGCGHGPAEPEPIWAEKDSYRDCQKKLPNNTCVRAMYHLQGSNARFQMNCQTGDLQNRTEPHAISMNYFPKNLFPDGPKCGKVEGGLVILTADDYGDVCEKCFDSVADKPADSVADKPTELGA